MRNGLIEIKQSRGVSPRSYLIQTQPSHAHPSAAQPPASSPRHERNPISSAPAQDKHDPASAASSAKSPHPTAAQYPQQYPASASAAAASNTANERSSASPAA